MHEIKKIIPILYRKLKYTSIHAEGECSEEQTVQIAICSLIARPIYAPTAYQLEIISAAVNITEAFIISNQ